MSDIEFDTPRTWMLCSFRCPVCTSSFDRRTLPSGTVEVKEHVYSDIPPETVESVEYHLMPETYFESAKRLDPQTIIIQTDEFMGDRIGGGVVERMEEIIQQRFGSPLWQVNYKVDERYQHDHSGEELALRRLEATTFKYKSESEAEWEKAQAEPPDGIDPTAVKWKETERAPSRKRLFVYETQTGTQHLVPNYSLRFGEDNWFEGIAHQSVFSPIDVPCGTTTIDREEFAEGSDSITKYPEEVIEYQQRSDEIYTPNLKPQTVLDNVCTACVKRLAEKPEEAGDTIPRDLTIDDWVWDWEFDTRVAQYTEYES